MNRLGVMIDLSHVSVATMKAALQLSKAPVIFSHSSAFSLCRSRRNVPDDVLQLVVRNRDVKGTHPPASWGGVLSNFHPQPPSEQKNTSSLVMVNFYSEFVSCSSSATLSQVAGKRVGPHSGQVRDGLA